MSKQTDQLFDDEVSTGATLTSGTTVGGNEVYHLGNDGQGSGLDAEFVQGSAPIQTGVPYVWETVSESTGNQGAILSQFASPSSSPQGIGLDSSDSIWHADSNPDFIYQLDSGTLLGTKLTQL